MYDYEYPRRERDRGRDREREPDRERDKDRERYRDYDRERNRETERYRERDRGDRDLERGRGKDIERDLDRERNRYKIRDDMDRDRERGLERERYRDIDRERDEERNRQKNREYDREMDNLKEKKREIDYGKERERERDRRNDDYYNYKMNKENRNYRKSKSRSYSRHRSRSRDSDRIKREKERRKDSYSRNGIRQIEEAESYDRTILMYSFPKDVNERKIFNFFAKFDVLPIIDIKIIRDSRTNLSKSICYVEFDTKDRARQAINLSGQLLSGQPCIIVPTQAERNRQALATRLKKEKDKEKNPGLMNSNIVKYSKSNEQIDLNDAPMKIYVGGLTESLSTITEDDLANIFGFGDIDSIELHRDPITGRSKGYAFIQFHRGSKAKEVIQTMNGFNYQGHALKVGEANENNTVIKGKMFLAKQQQQQQLQQQQLQQQLQMNQQEKENDAQQELKEGQ